MSTLFLNTRCIFWLASKRVLLAIGYWLLATEPFSQNLVPNPSFEIYSACPTSLNQVPLAVPWVNPSSLASPDYYHQCSPPGIMSVPQHSTGYQHARTGGAYVGMISYNRGSPNSREYVQVELTDSLIAGNKYCVEFYANLQKRSVYAINSMGIYLSKDSIRNSFGVFSYSPQASNPLTNMLSDTAGWMPVSGVFTAAGGEKYITIGNFNTDANTDTMSIQPYILSQTARWAYYYIDDVSVVPLLEPEAGGVADTTICTGSSVALGAPPRSGVTYQWSPAAGLSCTDCSNPVATPQASTAYVLTIADTTGNYCIPQSTDTITVWVEDCDTLSSIALPLPNVFSPNGDGTNDVFRIPSKNLRELSVKIYNRWGNLVYSFWGENGFWDGRTSPAGEVCEAGVYYYILEATGNDEQTYRLSGTVTLMR